MPPWPKDNNQGIVKTSYAPIFRPIVAMGIKSIATMSYLDDDFVIVCCYTAFLCYQWKRHIRVSHDHCASHSCLPSRLFLSFFHFGVMSFFVGLSTFLVGAGLPLEEWLSYTNSRQVSLWLEQWSETPNGSQMNLHRLLHLLSSLLGPEEWKMN